MRNLIKRFFGGERGSVAVPIAPASPGTDAIVQRANDRASKLSSSGMYLAFNPKQPISDPEFLSGRTNEIDLCIDQLMAKGGHVLIYGDRGVGKSSIGYVLASIFPKINEFSDYKTYMRRCDGLDTIQTIFSGPLRDLGVDVTVLSQRNSQEDEVEKKAKLGGVAAMGIGVASVSLNGGAESSSKKSVSSATTHISAHDLADQASWIAEVISEHKGLLFIDEMERIGDDSVKFKIATIIKHVSDNPRAKFKFLLAGIAQNAAELTANHPSVQRCLAEVQLGRLEVRDIMKILELGEKYVKIPTKDGVRPLVISSVMKKEIAKRTHGYPYFAHLIGQGAVKLAIDRGDNNLDEQVEFSDAIDYAYNNAEGRLRKSLDYAIENDEKGRYRGLLIAAAELDSSTLSAQEWVAAYSSRWNESLTANQLSPYLSRLVANRDQVDSWQEDGLIPIFTRIGSGAYRFTDPRMPSFIRMALSGSANRFINQSTSVSTKD